MKSGRKAEESSGGWEPRREGVKDGEKEESGH